MVIYLILHSPVGICSPLLMSALLHHLRETVGDGQGGVDETLYTALQTCLRPVVQLRARTVHTLVPADISESVDLEMTELDQQLITVELRSCGDDGHLTMKMLYNM